MPPRRSKGRTLSRRVFVRDGALVAAGSATLTRALWADDARPEPLLRIGLVTDLHYADTPALGTRHYRETPDKLRTAIDRFTRDKVDFTVELGDLVDAAASVDDEKGYLAAINKQLAALPGERHYVLGNHCVQTLTKAEFLAGIEREASRYSFDARGWHFVVLDACFRSDGKPYGRNNFTWTDANLPAKELDWLAADLAKAEGRTIVLAHQRLDVTRQHSVKNAAAVRKLLEASGKVLAVLQGHSHQNDHHEIGGIHYCTLAAMVEGSGAKNNAFARLDCLTGEAIQIAGFVRQASYDWK